MYHNHHLHETKHLKEANLLQEEKYRHLTNDPVGKLVCEMAVPTIISMLVTAVYNLADTFFVGLMRSNAATGAVGVVFSLMAIIQATGFFFGQGSGNYISRQLGRHQTEDAEAMAITAVTLAFSAGVVLLILGQIFLEPLALLLGSTETILPYACDYLRIILLGAPYMTASFVLNNQLRFQGSAMYSMIGIVAGAVINVGLDPLLIFTFRMGIKGAALATIIGQLFSFALLLFGCTRGGNLRLHPRKIQFSRHIFKEILRGGFPSLCRQSLMAISTICLNNASGLYGDAAIAAMSVVSRVMTMANSALIGFGQGFQPVCGFNYGAKIIARVRKTLWLGVAFATSLAVIMWALVHLFPNQIVGLFGITNASLADFTIFALKVQLLMLPLVGFQIVGSNYFQATGQPMKSMILSLTRQVLFLLPLMFWLPEVLPGWFPQFTGLDALYIATPVADFLAIFTVGIFIAIEMRRLKDVESGKIISKY